MPLITDVKPDLSQSFSGHVRCVHLSNVVSEEQSTVSATINSLCWCAENLRRDNWELYFHGYYFLTLADTYAHIFAYTSNVTHIHSEWHWTSAYRQYASVITLRLLFLEADDDSVFRLYHTSQLEYLFVGLICIYWWCWHVHLLKKTCQGQGPINWGNHSLAVNELNEELALQIQPGLSPHCGSRMPV